MDADPESNGVVARIGVTQSKSFLDGHATLHRGHDAGKFQQYAVAGGLHDPAAMFRDQRITMFGPKCVQTLQRAGFIQTHEARVAHHIRGYDCG